MMIRNRACQRFDTTIGFTGLPQPLIWTPLIPSTIPGEAVEEFGKNTPLKRPGQPAALAPVYVLLASNDSSYMTGALVPVTGGRPML